MGTEAEERLHGSSGDRQDPLSPPLSPAPPNASALAHLHRPGKPFSIFSAAPLIRRLGSGISSFFEPPGCVGCRPAQRTEAGCSPGISSHPAMSLPCLPLGSPPGSEHPGGRAAPSPTLYPGARDKARCGVSAQQITATYTDRTLDGRCLLAILQEFMRNGTFSRRQAQAAV